MLVLISEGASGSISYPINQTITLVGRDDEADWLLESRQVSRKHCILVDSGDFLLVRDLASTNGTFINGKRTHAGKLKEGDTLSLGEISFKVQKVPTQKPANIRLENHPNTGLSGIESALSSQNYNRAVS